MQFDDANLSDLLRQTLEIESAQKFLEAGDRVLKNADIEQIRFQDRLRPYDVELLCARPRCPFPSNRGKNAVATDSAELEGFAVEIRSLAWMDGCT
jgi:hypothetical protein